MVANTEEMTVLVTTIVLITVTPIIYILTAPLVLKVNTDKSAYSLNMGRLCSVRAVAALDNPGIGLRIGFWKKKCDMAHRRLKLDTTVGKILQLGNTKKKYGSRGFMQRILCVFRTFSVSKCDVMLDTDDHVLNAQLFPLFQYFTAGGGIGG